jgi:phosphoribosyl 1,2-cyclic phosphodiesterase
MVELTIWGSRGSIPTTGPEFQRHGGATTCLEVRFTDDVDGSERTIIVDGGTGLATLGRSRSLTSALILQSHFHWDHIQGFPFFASFFDPSAYFECWAVSRDNQTFRDVLSEQMSKPKFPVSLDALAANLRFQEIEEVGSVVFGGCLVSWTEVSHPSGSSAYRFDCGGASVVVTGDVESRAGSGQRLVEFARGADTLIMDAQYFPEEYESRRGWGHSTPLDAVGIAMLAGVERLIMTHHDPTHDDDRLDEKLRLARSVAAGRVEVVNAFDGMKVEWPNAENAEASRTPRCGFQVGGVSHL